MNINFIEKQHQQQCGESLLNSHWPTQLNTHVMKSNQLLRFLATSFQWKEMIDPRETDVGHRRTSPLNTLLTANDVAINTVHFVFVGDDLVYLKD